MKRLQRIVCFWPLLVTLLSVGIFSGCETSSSLVRQGEGEPSDYVTKLRPGDKVSIQFTEPGMPSPWEQTIGESGAISLPHNRSVHAAGLTKTELEKAIRDVYVPELYRRMSPLVQVEDRYYHVSGEVRNPGQIRYAGSVTVIKAITSAGGFNEFADRGHVQIIRGNESYRINAKQAIDNPEKYDVTIHPGDTVVVHRRF